MSDSVLSHQRGSIVVCRRPEPRRMAMAKEKAGVAKRSTWKIASESVPTDSFGFNANFKPFMLQNFETNNNGNVGDFPCGCRGSARVVVLLVL